MCEHVCQELIWFKITGIDVKQSQIVGLHRHHTLNNEDDYIDNEEISDNRGKVQHERALNDQEK